MAVYFDEKDKEDRAKSFVAVSNNCNYEEVYEYDVFPKILVIVVHYIPAKSSHKFIYFL